MGRSNSEITVLTEFNRKMNQVVNVPPNLELDSSSHKLGAGAAILAVLSYILLIGTGFPPTD